MTNKYSEEQIIKVLQEIDAGASIASTARKHGITDKTIQRWRQKYAGMSQSELAELKVLQAENRRLRHIVSELSLDIAACKEVIRGKW